MGPGRKKRKSKSQLRIAALRKHDPVTVSNEDNWSHFEPEEYKNAPHSFVIHKGKVGKHLKELMRDIRLIHEPYTASKLKVQKGSVLKDYVAIAGYFHVSHLSIISRTSISPYLKICKLPRGPTLLFRIMNYTLARDVLAALKKQVTYDSQFHNHPLLIMNNFLEEQHLKLVSTTFQNMFPSINLNKVNLSQIRRVLLVNYIDSNDTIEIRHYTTTYKATGVPKPVKKVLTKYKHGQVPNLSSLHDMSEFLKKSGEISESEPEDVTEVVAVGDKDAKRISKGINEVGIKLVELGPRLRLQLIKIEDGLNEGEVLYHKLVAKTPEEKLKLRRERNVKRQQKILRRKQQEANVQKKLEKKEQMKQKCLEGMRKKYAQSTAAEVDDDDREWYRQEVGKDPEEGTLS